MPRQRARRKGSETRALITEAVTELYAESGWAALTSNAIAKKVGVTSAALYRHHANQEALIQSAVRETHEHLHRFLYEEAGDLRALAVPERMTMLGVRYLQYIHQHPAKYALILATGSHPGFSSFIKEEVPEPIRSLLTDLREGQDQGLYDPTVPTVLLLGRLIGAIEGAARFTMLGTYGPEEVLQHLPFLVRGVGPRGPNEE